MDLCGGQAVAGVEDLPQHGLEVVVLEQQRLQEGDDVVAASVDEMMVPVGRNWTAPAAAMARHLSNTVRVRTPSEDGKVGKSGKVRSAVCRSWCSGR
jgi:hypothetical protein